MGLPFAGERFMQAPLRYTPRLTVFTWRKTRMKKRIGAFPVFTILALWIGLAHLGLAQTPINNGLQPNDVGYMNMFVGNGGESQIGFVTLERRIDGAVLPSQEAVDFFIPFAYTGRQQFRLSATQILTNLERLDLNTVRSSGFFQGQLGNQIIWNAVTTMIPGEPEMVTRYEFSSQDGPLGTLQFAQYLDGDIGAGADDIVFTRGASATEDLEIYTLDVIELHGVSQSGSLTPAQGLTNATFEGWASGVAPALLMQIDEAMATYSPLGDVIFPPRFDPIVGNNFGPGDIGTAMAWMVDPLSSNAVVTTTLRGVGSFRGAQPDLAVTKDASSDIFEPGENIQYDIVVSNAGAATTGVVLQDTFPPGIFSTVSANGGATVDIGGGTIAWNIGDMDVGDSVSLTVLGRLRPSNELCGLVGFGAVPITNTVVVMDDGRIGIDANPTNNTGVSTVIVNIDGGPLLVNCPADMDLGCNPTSIPTVESITAQLTLGNGTLATTTTREQSRCNITEEHTFTVSNPCGTTSCTVRVSWIEDTEAPQFLDGVPSALTDTMIDCDETPPDEDLGAFLQALAVDGSPFSNVYFYGDSLTDMGNLFALSGGTNPTNPPYFNGRFSSGPVWSELVAQGLGLPISSSSDGGNNYAVGGSTTDANPAGPFGLTDQVVRPNFGDAESLYFVWIGANDVLGALQNPTNAAAMVDAAIANINASLQTLSANGGRQFVLLNLPDLSLTPGILNQNSPAASSAAQQLTTRFNASLATAFLGVNSTAQVIIDVNTLFNDLLANPAQLAELGITDTTGRAIDNPTADPDTFLFMDDLHPTAPVHTYLADQVLRTVRAQIAPPTPDDVSCGLAVADVSTVTNDTGVIRTYTAIDLCSNRFEHVQTFAYTPDPTPPTLSNIPGSFTDTGNLNCEYTVRNYLPEVLASDDCTSNLVVEQSPSFGTVLRGPGTFDITFSTMDRSGNPASESFQITIQCPVVDLATISGTTYNDRNGNGMLDVEQVIGPTDSPNLVLLVDASDSSGLIQENAVVGDVNGDGSENTGLDVAAFAYNTLLQRLATNTPNAQVTVIDFDSSARVTNLRPNGLFPAISPVRPGADIDSNGTPDAVDAIASLDSQGGTDYGDAFTLAYNELGALDADAMATTVLLISDGGSDADFINELATLRTRANDIRAYALGRNVNFPSLFTIDPNTPTISSDVQLQAFMNTVVLGTERVVDTLTDDPVAGITVYLDQNDNGLLDAGEPSAVTDANGNYTINDVFPGSYILREVVPDGQQATNPLGGAYTVTLGEGEDLTDFDFYNFDPNATDPGGGGGGTNVMSGVINGTVWNDGANDGSPAGDNLSALGLPGVTVRLVGNGLDLTTTTGNDGSYSFSDVPAGDYTVSVDADTVPDTLPTSTTPRTYTFSFDPNDTASVPELVFGFRTDPAAITLLRFEADATGVEWQTGFEENTLGFFVLRSVDGGDWETVDETLTLAEGGESVYRVEDPDRPVGEVRYQLQEIRTDLSAETYGLIGCAQPVGGQLVSVQAEDGIAEFTIPEGADSVLVIGLRADASIRDVDQGITLYGATLDTEGGTGVYFSWSAGASIRIQ